MHKPAFVMSFVTFDCSSAGPTAASVAAGLAITETWRYYSWQTLLWAWLAVPAVAAGVLTRLWPRLRQAWAAYNTVRLFRSPLHDCTTWHPAAAAPDEQVRKGASVHRRVMLLQSDSSRCLSTAELRWRGSSSTQLWSATGSRKEEAAGWRGPAVHGALRVALTRLRLLHCMCCHYAWCLAQAVSQSTVPSRKGPVAVTAC